ncbi:MAG: peptidylprolyl isomerase [Clostridia bacterium]|nr:peptidylprolyl isomerase [Clostridia bacterium]
MSTYQLESIKSGDTVALMHTNMGDIEIKLFCNKVPKATENFITHAKNGYYNGIVFHRVIKDFMIQGGDPTATGMGGESIWGESFEDEFDTELHNIRGALSMANAGPGTNGSQFFIVGAKSVPENMLSQMRDMKDRGFPEDIVTAYEELGGTPWLDFRHTVFGQVINGIDVVDSIANVPVGANDKPIKDVVINSIEIKEI